MSMLRKMLLILCSVMIVFALIGCKNKVLPRMQARK